MAATCVLPAHEATIRESPALRPAKVHVVPCSREKLGDAFVARDITFTAEHAPVDRERGQPEGATVMCERIEEGIGRGVIALRRIAED